jgi:elongation factor G
MARVVIDMVPREDDQVTFEDRSKGGVVPLNFVKATEKGIRAALAEGPRGHPVVGVAVVLLDGETHAVDSSEAAFQRAGSEAIRQALAQAGTVLLEPVMEVVIETPSTHVGDVVGDLQRRLGRVLSIEDNGARTDVVAHAPLAKLDGYATALRSLTQGRASASLAFDRYEAARTG